MIVIDRRVLKKLEEFREHLHLEDTLSEFDFLKIGGLWYLMYALIELGGRYLLTYYGFTAVFFDQIWWIPRLVFLVSVAKRLNTLLPHKTLNAMMASTATWGACLGAVIGIEKVLMFRDLAHLFLIPAEALSLFIVGNGIAYFMYKAPLSLLYKQTTHEEN